MTGLATWRRVVAVAAVLLLASAGTAVAQLQTGNIYVTTADNQGQPLPGVTVTLSGIGAPQTMISNAQGQARFLGLSPGNYRIEASLEGFSTVVHDTVNVRVGRNTAIELRLSPAVEEVITVTAESPLLDERRIAPGATLTKTELDKIPTSRDPWAILQTVPGVQTDRINVGGNESGQQSLYVGPGSSGDNATWSVDGVVITDMTAVGSSPTYYDFDAFEEMQASTGGTDVTISTGGVALNMVTKRGTNEWRGSGRYFLTDDSWQSDLDFKESDLGPSQETFTQGNRIVEIKDWGAELGGPIVRDRLWIWGHYGRQEPHLLTIQDVSDFTKLETYGAKLNAQITPNNSAVGFYMRGDKIKIGRNASPTRPQPTTWNQSGPSDIYKVEDTHIFGSNFYLTGMLSHVAGGFQLTPQAGYPNGPVTALDADFVWQNNFLHYETDRPQDQAKLDGSYFFTTGNVNHELKFGAGFRRAEVESLTAWAGDALRLDYYTLFGYDFNIVQITRPGLYAATIDYTSLYAQDTMTFGNLTINAGLRYDIQDGDMDPARAPAVAGFEDVLPAIDFAGGDDGFEWKTLAPRLGLTYALGGERRTLLRASFARFADQLNHYQGVLDVSPTALGYAYYYYLGDLNGDGRISRNEIVDPDDGPLWTNGYPAPGQLSPNRVDPGYDAPLTDEILLGVEHAVRPELVIGAQVTWRNLFDLNENERLVRDAAGNVRPHQRSDYCQMSSLPVTIPRGGGSHNVPRWGLCPGITDTQGFLRTNGDREQDYLGFSLTFNKRLSNRWMARGSFTWSEWEWNTPDSEREDPNQYLGGTWDDGGPVLQGSGTGSGTKGAIYINSNWSYSLTGLYQIAPDRPWGFNVALGLNGREGYPVPYFVRTGLDGIAGSANLQVLRADEFRNPDIHIVDARLEKELQFQDFGVTLSVDGFNLFNEGTVLQRQHRLLIGTSANVLEVVSARVFRVGARFSFR